MDNQYLVYNGCHVWYFPWVVAQAIMNMSPDKVRKGEFTLRKLAFMRWLRTKQFGNT